MYSVPFLSRLDNGEASGYGVVTWGGVGFTALRCFEGGRGAFV